MAEIEKKTPKGRPHICVPIMAKDFEALVQMKESLSQTEFDFIEFRADVMAVSELQTRLEEMLTFIKAYAPKKQLIFTYRRLKEGGQGRNDALAYKALCERAIACQAVDVLDVEYALSPEIRQSLIQGSFEEGKQVILSKHLFESCPDKNQTLSTLMEMSLLDPTWVKFAVMPSTEAHVLAFMSACQMFKVQQPKQKLIAIAMGQLGLVSRVFTNMSGSEITFAALNGASAPGQMPVAMLSHLLDCLYS